jgi:curli biogenesis system outer membrane secretion channel CsgG
MATSNTILVMNIRKPLTTMLALASCWILAWGPFPVKAEDASPPTLFVAPLKPDATLLALWQPALGKGLAEMLITELTKINKFQVLESTALDSLKDEIRLGEDGFVAADDKVQKGGWAGADFMFVGTVTRFGSSSKGIGLGGFAPGGIGNLGLKTSKNEVRIDWRIVDAATRKILHSGNAEASHSGVGFNIGVGVNGSGGNIGFNNKEFMDSALGKATAKAVSNIVAAVAPLTIPQSGKRQLAAKAAQAQQQAAQAAQAAEQAAAVQAAAALKSTPGKVLAAPNSSTIIVSLGSKHGFKNGDKLKLYEPNEIKDEKGNVVFTEEKLVGELTIEAVNTETSKTAYAGDKAVKPGWVVKSN